MGMKKTNGCLLWYVPLEKIENSVFFCKNSIKRIDLSRFRSVDLRVSRYYHIFVPFTDCSTVEHASHCCRR